MSVDANLIDALRTAVADYMYSEGCSCCRDIPAHQEHAKQLAELLGVAMYEDQSGYDFDQYATHIKEHAKEVSNESK